MEKTENTPVIANSEIVEQVNSIDLDNVLDGFIATKRSNNTKRAYARDIGDLFTYLGCKNTSELGDIQFHDLVVRIQGYLEECTEYDESTRRPINHLQLIEKRIRYRAFSST